MRNCLGVGGEKKQSPYFKKMAVTIMFSQSSRRSLCWIIQYLFLFGCRLFPGRVSSCFRKELGLGGLLRHLLFRRQRWASGPLWTEGIQNPRQDKVKGNWPAWSFSREGGRAHPFIFSQRPRSLSHAQQTKYCLRPARSSSCLCGRGTCRSRVAAAPVGSRTR